MQLSAGSISEMKLSPLTWEGVGSRYLILFQTNHPIHFIQINLITIRRKHGNAAGSMSGNCRDHDLVFVDVDHGRQLDVGRHW